MVEIATLLLGPWKVMNPMPTPLASVPLGRPASKSSIIGSAAASAGTTDTNGEINKLITRLKMTITENAGFLFFIVFLLVKLTSIL